MTPEEKAKLFEAIGYQATYSPKEFVENKFDFRLGQVVVIVDGAVFSFLLDLRAGVGQRPIANAVDLKSTIRELRMDGCGAEMWRIRDPSTYSLHGKYDQSVELAIALINLKYHAPAVNNAVDVFKPP